MGFILGYRQAAVCVAGSIVSSLLLIPLIAFLGEGLTAPLAPEATRLVRDMSAGQIWARYVRYIGAGAVATAGILTVLRGLPTMVGAFSRRGARPAKKDAAATAAAAMPRAPTATCPARSSWAASRPWSWWPASCPGSSAAYGHLGVRLVCALGVGVFGVIFVTVAARIVGIVGVTSQPTSGITLVTLLGIASIFAAMGWTEPGAARGRPHRGDDRGHRGLARRATSRRT